VFLGSGQPRRRGRRNARNVPCSRAGAATVTFNSAIVRHHAPPEQGVFRRRPVKPGRRRGRRVSVTRFSPHWVTVGVFARGWPLREAPGSGGFQCHTRSKKYASRPLSAVLVGSLAMAGFGCPRGGCQRRWKVLYWHRKGRGETTARPEPGQPAPEVQGRLQKKCLKLVPMALARRDPDARNGSGSCTFGLRTLRENYAASDSGSSTSTKRWWRGPTGLGSKCTRKNGLWSDGGPAPRRAHGVRDIMPFQLKAWD